MNTAQIEVPMAEAKQHFLNYRAALKQKFSAEDQAFMRGYKWLMKGRKLLDLGESFRLAGVDELHRPRLAIARCDWRMVYFGQRWERGEYRYNFSAVQSPHRNAQIVSLEVALFPRETSSVRCRSVVPTVPPQFRPSFNLDSYHILWEPVWESVPSDPILLKHCGGMLYVVLAQWDLTPLEQAILRGRKPTA